MTEPKQLVCGYYIVTKEGKARVARWMPQGKRNPRTGHEEPYWTIGGGFEWPAGNWDSIGSKVA